MCTVAPKWGAKLGMALVKVMVCNAYWTTSIGYRAGKIDV
jgi:hypothetical protein